ncbi:MAG: DUF2249 domain-containing protein [Rhodocyclaceae bacterium]|nr:DUF2249 domain-containing protein [Rhodocyclaceae bacterium]
MPQIVIDARGLPPPRPLEMVMEALDDLHEGDELLLLLHCEPIPLYRVLANNGYGFHSETAADGSVSIHISLLN